MKILWFNFVTCISYKKYWITRLKQDFDIILKTSEHPINIYKTLAKRYYVIEKELDENIKKHGHYKIIVTEKTAEAFMSVGAAKELFKRAAKEKIYIRIEESGWNANTYSIRDIVIDRNIRDDATVGFYKGGISKKSIILSILKVTFWIFI